MTIRKKYRIRATAGLAWRFAGVLGVGLLAACGPSTPESLLASGKEYSAKGDHKGAVIQYKTALQQEPNSVEARTLLGQALLDAGDPFSAVVELSKALDQKAPTAQVLPALSRSLVLLGDYKKLVTAYGQLELDDKQALAALKVNVATAWGALNDRAKTEAAIAAAFAAVPDYPPARVMQARVVAGRGGYEEAQALVDQALATDPKLYEAWMLRGELFAYGKNDQAKADEAFRKVLAIEPKYILAYSALIGARIRARDVPGAKALAAEMRKAVPDHPLTVLMDGQIAYLDRDLPRARDLAQQLLRFSPDNLWVLVFAGFVEADMGAVVQAEAHFAKAVQLAPGFEVARRKLAEAQLRLGQPAKALQTLKPTLDAPAPTVGALALAGDAELRLNNPDAAENYFLRAAKVDPANKRVQTAVALSRIWRGDSAGGLADLEGLAAQSKDTYADQALVAARMKRREYAQALTALDRIAQKEPNNAGSHELRGRVQMARNDLPAARAAFEAAAKADPSLFAAVSGLASIDLLEGKPMQAMERLQATLTANPRNTSALVALAELKVRTGAPLEESKKLLADAILSAPDNAAPRLQLIALLLNKRQYKDALAAAREAATALPADTAVLDAVGNAQMQAGDTEQAANTFRRLAAAEVKSARPYLQLARLYTAGGQRSQAESALGQALEVEPNNAQAQAALLDLLMNSNRQDKALDYIRRLKANKPKQPVPYLLEATYHRRLKNEAAAAASLREGILKTNSSELVVELHKLLLRTGRGVEADRLSADWLKKNPQDGAVEYQMAATDILRNQLGTAEERLKRVLAVAPDNPLALNNMAWVLVTQGKPGALPYARRAAELLPDRAAIVDTLAMALAAEKQLPEAVKMQVRAVELAPKENALRLNLAKLALQAGDKDLARRELQRLRDAGSGFARQAEVTQLMQGL